ncbi:hypothetical protein D9615_008452 [Tricholomella constricta]|uniref:Uncharacterized protein n=1 Tax=Tricholomella constricta TaxID=117010 RepID=A0A8H5M0E9_9AGAR|nr:hypothetical protein D9615_008452 [Tricholomella constricta]
MVNTPGRCTARLPPVLHVKPTDCVLNRATCTQSVQLAMNTAQPHRMPSHRPSCSREMMEQESERSQNSDTDAKGAIGTWYDTSNITDCPFHCTLLHRTLKPMQRARLGRQLKVDPKRATGTHNEHIETPRRFVIAGTRGVGL